MYGVGRGDLRWWISIRIAGWEEMKRRGEKCEGVKADSNVGKEKKKEEKKGPLNF